MGHWRPRHWGHGLKAFEGGDETNTYQPHHTLDYYSRERVANLVRGMLAFLSWCDRSDLASYTRYDSSEVRSRQRHTVAPDLAVVTYLSRFELHLSPDLANRLQIFLHRFDDRRAA